MSEQEKTSLPGLQVAQYSLIAAGLLGWAAFTLFDLGWYRSLGCSMAAMVTIAAVFAVVSDAIDDRPSPQVASSDPADVDVDSGGEC